MISTQLKKNLPHSLSYPIGAAALSEALDGAPHVEDFSVWFSDHGDWPASEFQRILTGRLPYGILTAKYRPQFKPGYGGPRSMIDKGRFDEKWELHVYPVIRELRHLANGLLRDEGLRAVVNWLQASSRKGWDSRSQVIKIIFHPAEGSISVVEECGV